MESQIESTPKRSEQPSMNDFKQKMEEVEEIELRANEVERWNDDAFKTTIVQIEEVLEAKLGPDNSPRRVWEEGIGQLLNDYQYQLEELQSKYISKVTNVYKKSLPAIPEVEELLGLSGEEEQPKEGYIGSLRPKQPLLLES